MIRSDQRFTFEQSPAEIWEAMSDTSAFTRWWPWVRRVEAEGLVSGAVWSCHIQPPLPYSLRFTITLGEVVPVASARATIAGDVTGTAELTLVPLASGGASARLVTDLAPASPVLRALALVARPLVVWGHDWVMAEGVRQFMSRGLRQVPEPGGPTP